jgi:phosphate starvation-inducible protein PhoH and related proteins
MSRKSRKSKPYHIKEEEDCLYDKKKFHVNEVRTVRAITDTQLKTFRSYFENQHLVLHGVAGSGKTFIALYLALTSVLDPDTNYEKIMIVRSNVPTRDLGHLPGELDEKLSVFEDPYRQICDELFQFSKSYDNMKKSRYIDFISTSYLRGLTFRNTIVLVDEVENLSYHEISSIITRIGKGSRIIFTGDTAQTDLRKSSRDQCGLGQFIKVAERMPSMDIHSFGIRDIVRSGIVKEFILAELECV